MIDLLQEIMSTIRRNKLRTALTGFAVAWGIFMLIVLLGAGNGVIHAFQSQSLSLKTNSVSIFPGMTSEVFQGLNKGRKVELNERDRAFMDSKFPTRIEASGAVCSQSGVNLTYGKEHVSISIDGVLPTYTELKAINLVQGRFLNQRDLDEHRKVLVLHEKTVKILFPKGQSPIGKYIRASESAYQVVGVYTDQNAFTPSALAPLTTIQLLYQKADKIDQMTFTTQGLESVKASDDFSNEFRAELGKRKHFAPTDQGAIWIHNRFKQNLQQQSATKLLNIAIWVIGIFTLLSGIVGVSNIMLITVRERTHEFGIRKALGAKPSSILWLIISESVIITTFFGYLGMVAGVAVTEYMNVAVGTRVVDAGAFSLTVFKDPTVDLTIAIQATITLIIAGTLAGFFPARKAANIRPIEALRAD